MTMRSGLIIGAVFLSLALPAYADNDPPSSQTTTQSNNCKHSASNQPATQPAKGSNDGTAPGNSGSTGWTGGMGGSHIGTNPSGATEDSKTFQPAVARGLDPIKGMPAAQKC